MQEIGITGGIGSGKSTVARAFQALGYSVYYADDRAKALYDEDPTVKSAVKELLGPEMYDHADHLIRPKLAEKIFGDKALLTKINAIVHPAVVRDYAAWLQHQQRSYSKPLIFKEAAIMFEAGTITALNAVIMVYAPIQVRVARVQARDGVSTAQVRARMTHQWPDSTKLFHSNFVIYNDGHHALEPQLQAAIQYFSHP